jgi:hypothetical protein
MTKFISVMWSENITQPEGQILNTAVERVFKHLYLRHPAALFDPPIRTRVFGNWVIPAQMPDKPYWGTQWYIDSSLDKQLQRVIAPIFLEIVRQEPWQHADPHLDLALLEQELTDYTAPLARLHPDHYSLGSSLPGTAAVMSVFRVRTLSDAPLRDMALTRLVQHHLGHVLAVPAFERREFAVRRGLEMHCTDRCVMRHAETVEELAALAREEAEMAWPFCQACTRDLHSVIVRHLGVWN